jgi:hypothetical protein
VLLLFAVRLALAILLDAAALVIWDVGTRPPLTLVADVRRAVAQRRGLVAGTMRFLIGVALIALGAWVVGPMMPDRRTFTIVQTGILIAALIVEQLLGPDLRGRRRAR